MPGLAAVGGLEKCRRACRRSRCHIPRTLAGFPKRRIQDVGIGWIDGDVGSAGILVLVEDFLPVLAAVGGDKDAALFVGTVGMAQHGGEEMVGIARIDGQRGNLLAVAQAEVRPGLAGVGGFVDAVADGEIGTLQAFAAGDVNDVRIRGRDRDGANGLRGFVVEDGRPGAAVVVGFQTPPSTLPM